MKKPEVSIMTITPNMAENWLRQNSDRNRKLRRAKVEQYAADMGAKRWRLSDQAISFDVDSNLVNGQHRLEAVLLADTPIVSLVLKNLPTDAMLVLDGGMKRNTDDNFKMAGKEYPRQSGGTVRRVMLGVRSYAGRAFTDQEVDEFLRVHGEAVTFAHRVLPNGRFGNASLRAPLTRAAIDKKNDRRRLEKFGEVVVTGMMVPGDEAAVLLRNFILQDLSLHGGGARSQLYGKTEAALVAFVRGEKVKRLAVSKEELFPIPGETGWATDAPRLHEAIA